MEIVAFPNTIKQLNNRICTICHRRNFCLNLSLIFAVWAQIVFASDVADLADEENAWGNDEDRLPPACSAHVLVKPWVLSLILKCHDIDESETNEHHDVVEPEFWEGQVFRVVHTSIINLLKKCWFCIEVAVMISNVHKSC